MHFQSTLMFYIIFWRNKKKKKDFLISFNFPLFRKYFYSFHKANCINLEYLNLWGGIRHIMLNVSVQSQIGSYHLQHNLHEYSRWDCQCSKCGIANALSGSVSWGTVWRMSNKRVSNVYLCNDDFVHPSIHPSFPDPVLLWSLLRILRSR